MNITIRHAHHSVRRKLKDAPVQSALQHCIHKGWSIAILPWVFKFGIRGLADKKHLYEALKFLDIPKPKWKGLINDSVRVASV